MPKRLTKDILYCKIQKKQGDKMNYLVSKIVTFLTEQEVISSESDVQDFYR